MTNLEDLENEAIEFIKKHAKEPYILYFSGGKGSVIVRHLLQRAAVPYIGVYKKQGFEAEDVIEFIKEFDDIIIVGNERSLLQMVEDHIFLPQHFSNDYCCLEPWDYFPLTEGYCSIGGMTMEPWREDMKKVFRDNNGRVADISPILEWDEGAICGYMKRYGLEAVPEYEHNGGRFNCAVCPMYKGITKENFQDYMEMWKKYPEQLQMHREASDRSYDILIAKSYPVLAKDKEEYFRMWCCKEKLVGGVENIIEIQQ